MIDLQLAFLMSRLQGTLEFAIDPLLTELLLNAIDDGHDALDITIKYVTDLQALECDHAVVLFGAFVRRHGR